MNTTRDAVAEYLRRKLAPVEMEAEDTYGQDPGDMDRSLSPEPLNRREPSRFASLMDSLDAPRLAAEAEVARGYAVADEVSDTAGRMLGRDGIPAAPVALGTRKPVLGTGLPSDAGGGGLGYLDALTRAQQMDELTAATRATGNHFGRMVEAATRGAYKPGPVGTGGATEVEKLAQRRALVAEYLKQQRDAEESASNSAYKLALAKRMAESKVGPREDPLLEPKKAKLEADTDAARARAERDRRPPVVRPVAPKAEKPAKEPKPLAGIPPGYEIDPKQPPTDDQLKKFNDLLASREELRSYTSQMRELLKQANGGQYLPGQLRTAISQLATIIQLKGKDIAGLGALSGPDMGLMEKVASNPSEMGNVLRDMPTMLNGLDAWADKPVQAREKVWGIRQRSSVASESASPAGMVRVRRKRDGAVIPMPADQADALVTHGLAERVP